MSEDQYWRKKLAEAGNGFLKGTIFYNLTQGEKYKIDINENESKSAAVNVMDKTELSSKQIKQAAKGKYVGPPKGESIFRLDRPHPGADFDHININERFSKLSSDPHYPLPPGTITAGIKLAKFAQNVNKVNEVALPLAVAMDSARLICSVHDDVEHGTTRNAAECIASVAGGWLGAMGGAMGGAAVGASVLPGIGTIIGGIIGSFGGGIGGSVGGGALVEVIADVYNYDIVKKNCRKCGRRFKCRKYRGEGNKCPECCSKG